MIALKVGVKPQHGTTNHQTSRSKHTPQQPSGETSALLFCLPVPNTSTPVLTHARLLPSHWGCPMTWGCRITRRPSEGTLLKLTTLLLDLRADGPCHLPLAGYHRRQHVQALVLLCTAGGGRGEGSRAGTSEKTTAALFGGRSGRYTLVYGERRM